MLAVRGRELGQRGDPTGEDGEGGADGEYFEHENQVDRGIDGVQLWRLERHGAGHGWLLGFGAAWCGVSLTGTQQGERFHTGSEIFGVRA
jgi:hypothetical protein